MKCDNAIRKLKTIGIKGFLCVVCLGLIVVPGCSDGQDTVPTSPGGGGVVSSASDTSLPEKLVISVIKPAGVGQPTELRLTASAIHHVGNVTARLEFKCKRYDADYLSYTKWETVDPKLMQIEAKSAATGDLSYQHDVQFDYSVTFPYEGEWEILAYADGSENVQMGDYLYWSVQKEKAGGYGSDGWINDYAPSKATTIGVPFSTFLDINKPPRLNEEVELTWKLQVEKAYEETEIWFEYRRMNPYTQSFTKYDSTSFKKSGELTWIGSMNAGSEVSSKAMIAFPEEGDWLVQLWLRTPELTLGASEIYLHVDKDYSRWGWAEPHK